MHHSTEHLDIGYKIKDHYEIQKVLGQGGFGIVYLVKDTERLNNIFVIKELFAKEFSFVIGGICSTYFGGFIVIFGSTGCVEHPLIKIAIAKR